MSYMRPLLRFAAAHVPAQKHKETPLYILCTAGMRLLPERWVPQALPGSPQHPGACRGSTVCNPCAPEGSQLGLRQSRGVGARAGGWGSCVFRGGETP